MKKVKSITKEMLENDLYVKDSVGDYIPIVNDEVVLNAFQADKLYYKPEDDYTKFKKMIKAGYVKRDGMIYQITGFSLEKRCAQIGTGLHSMNVILDTYESVGDINEILDC